MVMKMVLNDGQYKIYKEAIAWFKSSSSTQVFEIDGLAGTGKSVLIHEILRGLNLRHDQYMPMAYTGQAAIVMRTKGFHTARSIHSSLYEVIEELDYDDINSIYGKPRKKKRFKKRKFIDPNVRLFFIDEAYMVPDRMVKDILSFGVKVIACGDQSQLPPINAAPAFLTGPHVHHLTELMRQSKDDPIIYIANRILNGEPIHNGLYGDSVMVINDYEFFPQMLGYADIMLTATNKTRDILNQFVRAYTHKVSLFPEFGERLICRQNNWDMQVDGIALANGLTGFCSAPPDPMFTTNKTFTINFKPDLINQSFDYVNVSIDYFLADYSKKQEYKSSFDAAKYIEGEFFEYAYALTTHLSQGAEYEKGLIFNEYMRPQIQRQLEYTAITRFKKSCIILRHTDTNLNLEQYIK
jgi:exodeoxyribonuclease-5